MSCQFPADTAKRVLSFYRSNQEVLCLNKGYPLHIDSHFQHDHSDELRYCRFENVNLNTSIQVLIGSPLDKPEFVTKTLKPEI